jgi:CDP-diacylglycerol---glycerol-3-phosphate 3-phosphatidyltransferase
MFDGRFRAPIEKVVRPVGRSLSKSGLTPDHLTVVGLVVAVGAAVALANGDLRLGLLLVVLAAVPDMLDGAVAKASNNSSQRGAFFDSVIDRITDGLLFFGVAWYFASTEGPYLALLPMSVMGVSQVISYQRAKAESLGLYAKGGLMERAERIILLCLGLLFDALLVPIMWLMLVLVTITAAQRFWIVWRQAEPAPIVVERKAVRRSRRVARRASWEHRRAEIRRRRRA